MPREDKKASYEASRKVGKSESYDERRKAAIKGWETRRRNAKPR